MFTHHSLIVRRDSIGWATMAFSETYEARSTPLLDKNSFILLNLSFLNFPDYLFVGPSTPYICKPFIRPNIKSEPTNSLDIAKETWFHHLFKFFVESCAFGKLNDVAEKLDWRWLLGREDCIIGAKSLELDQKRCWGTFEETIFPAVTEIRCVKTQRQSAAWLL